MAGKVITAKIEMSTSGKAVHKKFAYHRRGTRAEIRESAQHLLGELRQQGHKRSKVWIDGKAIRFTNGNGG